METGVMSESLVVPSDVHQTVTEVLGQLVLDDFKQTDITVKLLQEQVELNLGYSEGSPVTPDCSHLVIPSPSTYYTGQAPSSRGQGME